MNMIFGVKDRPKFGQTILFAIQQLLAIMAATLVVPVITNGATGSTLSPEIEMAEKLDDLGKGDFENVS